MNDQLFIDQWTIAPYRLQKTLKDFARFPTERNECYFVGYLAGYSDATSLDFDPAYWVAFSGQIKDGSEAQKFILNAKLRG
jgi:hypothetical protein